VLSALVPVVGALCAMGIAGDRISDLEWIAIAAISSGVAVACLPSYAVPAFALRRRERRSSLPAGSPAHGSTIAPGVPSR